MANREDPDEMLHKAAFSSGSALFDKIKQSLGTKIHHNLDISTCDPFANNMDNSITGTLANSEDPDEMPHEAAFHLGLHYLLR